MATGFDRGRLIALLKRDALRTGTFTLASGRISHYYVDGRTVTLSAEGAAEVGAGVLELISDLPNVGVVGGLTMGADPIVGATLAVAGAGGRPGMLGFLVRKEAKGHGTGKLVEGPLKPGTDVVIVDDVATTGGSSLQAVAAVEGDGVPGGPSGRGARPARRGGRGVRRPRARLPGDGHHPRPRRRAAPPGLSRRFFQGGPRPWSEPCTASSRNDTGRKPAGSRK